MYTWKTNRNIADTGRSCRSQSSRLAGPATKYWPKNKIITVYIHNAILYHKIISSFEIHFLIVSFIMFIKVLQLWSDSKTFFFILQLDYENKYKWLTCEGGSLPVKRAAYLWRGQLTCEGGNLPVKGAA